MTYDEVTERSYQRSIQPCQHGRESGTQVPVGNGLASVCFIFRDQVTDRNLGLSDDECGNNTDHHAGRHHQIGGSPWRVIIHCICRSHRSGYP